MSGKTFDTSVYINALRHGDLSVFSGRRDASVGEKKPVPLFLSVVVLEELYVGAGDGKMKKLLNKFENEFEKVNRLLIPNKTDWTNCGQVLSNIGQKYGFETVKRARMTNDCLIAMSARHYGLTVITHNAADFKLIAEFYPFNWEEI